MAAAKEISRKDAKMRRREEEKTLTADFAEATEIYIFLVQHQ
jgi:hypothetical protein